MSEGSQTVSNDGVPGAKPPLHLLHLPFSPCLAFVCQSRGISVVCENPGEVGAFPVEFANSFLQIHAKGGLGFAPAVPPWRCQGLEQALRRHSCFELRAVHEQLWAGTLDSGPIVGLVQLLFTHVSQLN